MDLVKDASGANKMPEKNTALSREFIAQQRKRLESLRKQILGEEEKAIADERASQEDRGDGQQDSGEQSIDLAQREISQGLQDVDKRRLSDIERALQKMEEGTYGLSDLGGEPIPKARLEATPEAVLSVQQEEQREKRNRR
jgi:DnaK suppressor protein